MCGLCCGEDGNEAGCQDDEKAKHADLMNQDLVC